MHVLVTGGSGFIGRSVVARLKDEIQVTAPALRLPTSDISPSHLNDHHDNQLFRDWNDVMAGKDVVVHLAGRAHLMHDPANDPLSAFRAINVDGTINLARMASQHAVKRFVLISSIGVNGRKTDATGFNENTPPAPHADYALSKWEAECELWKITKGTNMEVVIIRPPLVYAGNAPGNFHRLLQIIKAGIPLPLGSINNQRSMIALENIVDFIFLCIHHPAAANELFVISDGTDVSTPEIIRCLAKGMNRRSYLFPIPQSVLRTGASILGKSALYSQLCDSLVVDSRKARRLLGWKPTTPTDTALVKAGHDYMATT